MLQGHEEEDQLIFSAANEEEYEEWLKGFSKLYEVLEVKKLNV